MFEDVVDQYGFVPLKIEGLFELDRYLINDRGFVMIAKKNKRKTKGRLLLPRPDKDGFMYVTLRTLEGKREPFYVDYLLHNNNTKYRSFNL